MKYWFCYLAGSMSGMTFEASNHWRTLSKYLLEQIECDYKVRVVNPNTYYNFISKRYDSEEEIRRFDIRKVEQSDLIFVNLNGKSIGTAMELQHAFDLNIPIIGYKDDEEELHPWLQCVCDKIFDDIPTAVNYIEEYYLD